MVTIKKFKFFTEYFGDLGASLKFILKKLSLSLKEIEKKKKFSKIIFFLNFKFKKSVSILF